MKKWLLLIPFFFFPFIGAQQTVFYLKEGIHLQDPFTFVEEMELPSVKERYTVTSVGLRQYFIPFIALDGTFGLGKKEEKNLSQLEGSLLIHPLPLPILSMLYLGLGESLHTHWKTAEGKTAPKSRTQPFLRGGLQFGFFFFEGTLYYPKFPSKEGTPSQIALSTGLNF